MTTYSSNQALLYMADAIARQAMRFERDQALLKSVNPLADRGEFVAEMRRIEDMLRKEIK